MADAPLQIGENVLTAMVKGAPREFHGFIRALRRATNVPSVLAPPRDKYPLFEHLILFLYSRHISPTTPKATLFGDALSTTQKTNLGEAIDVLLYSRILPTSADIGTPLSFLDLFFHDQYGFKDDTVLLQRMWYIRAFVILLDGADGAGGGRRWKWYDYRLTLVIYSWVRHNRRYKGCPRSSCLCKQMIYHYGMSIELFKVYYKALEAQCISELQFVRSNEPAWVPSKGAANPSRAFTANLYEKPDKKTWPTCFSNKLKDPNLEEPVEGAATAQKEKQSKTETEPKGKVQKEHQSKVEPEPKDKTQKDQQSKPDPDSKAKAQKEQRPKTETEPKVKKSTIPPPITIPTARSGPSTATEKTTTGLPPPHPSLPQRPNVVSQVDPVHIDTSILASRLSQHSTKASTSTHTRSTSSSGEESAKWRMLPSPFSGSFQSPATTNHSGSSAAHSTSGRLTEDSSVTSESPNRAKMFAEQGGSRGNAAHATENKSFAAAATPSSNTSTPSMDPISPVLSEATATSPPKSPKILRSMFSQGSTSRTTRDNKTSGGHTTAAGSGAAQNNNLRGVHNETSRDSTSGALDSAGGSSPSKVSRGTTAASSTITSSKSTAVNTSSSNSKVSTVKQTQSSGTFTSNEQSMKHTSEGSSSLQKKPSPPALSNPVNPKPVTGKRSRDDGKETSSSEAHSRREAVTESSPIPPPAKRIKTAPEPSSPAQNQRKNVASTRNSTATVQPSKSAVSKQLDDQLSDNRKKNKNEGTLRKEDRTSTDAPVSNDIKRLRSTRSEGSETAPGGGRSVSPSLVTSDSASAKHGETKKPTANSKNAESKPNGDSDVLEREIQRRKNKPNRKSQASPNADNPERQRSAHGDVHGEHSDKLTGNKESKTTSSDANPKSSRTTAVYESKKSGEPNKANRVGNVTEPMIMDPALVPQANLSPPFPDLHALHTQLKQDSRLPSSILICAQDPDTRLHSTAHEARRLIYILLGFGIPLESWMISTTSQGIMIREEAIAIIYPLLSGRRIGQLREAGLQVQCTVSEATSDEEEPSIATSRIKGSLPSGAFDASGQRVRIVDTHLDRILRNPHAEKSRLIEMVAGLTNIEPEKLAGDASSFQSSLGSGSMLSLSYDTSNLLHWDNSSLLGRAGLVVYRGDVQLAGPIALSHGLSALSLSQDSFDWSALKSEVSKMKFPWEAETPSLTNQSISQPCAMSARNHASSPSGGPFMQLLRPLHWSSSSSVFSKMASAGLRWDPSGRPEESSDETDSQHSMD